MNEAVLEGSLEIQGYGEYESNTRFAGMQYLKLSISWVTPGAFYFYKSHFIQGKIVRWSALGG